MRVYVCQKAYVRSLSRLCVYACVGGLTECTYARGVYVSAYECTRIGVPSVLLHSVLS